MTIAILANDSDKCFGLSTYSILNTLQSLTLRCGEALVHVMAHELRHWWQAKVKKEHRIGSARGRFSDRGADGYAIRKTREWRRQHNSNTGRLGSRL